MADGEGKRWLIPLRRQRAVGEHGFVDLNLKLRSREFGDGSWGGGTPGLAYATCCGDLAPLHHC